ncbi:UNVERIFIED_CONTAM: protein FAR1-RELATED SEQUENCE 5 [Sesamum radiatum]|uniref:Protein FAR1-RELATED SEQUENCE 5 n=1 Tax=Sesamum radiatum TaxID=300843 RepID=A0AAW2W4M0_SESRA
MSALAEASKKVALAIKNEGKASISNGPMRDVSARGKIWPNHCAGEGQGSSAQQLSEDDMDQKINELSTDLERANRKCEVYRTNLFSLLKDIEDHKQRLSIEVQNIKLSMKDGL